MGFDGVFKLRQKRFEWFEDEVDRLVHGLIQFCTGQGAGFLVPLGDVELVVQRNQGGGHRVDDVVEVVLEPRQFFLDFAPNLYLKLQLAVGVACFFGQGLGLVVSRLCLVAGAF